MRQKELHLLLMMAVTIFCLSACSENNTGTERVSYSPAKPTKTISPLISSQPQNIMMKQFLEDAKMPIEAHEKFVTAIKGDTESLDWLEKYDVDHENIYCSVLYRVFPYKNGQYVLENEFYYNIGMLYYYGDENIPLKQNKDKAFYWLNLSADKGSFFGAIQAGDMAQSGDGISINEKIAFDLYIKSLENKVHGIAYERLAHCYENGIGTDIDKQKSQEYYYKSLLDGNPNGFYKLSTSDGISQIQSILFSKAASSLDYSASYFAMAYEGLDGYSSEDSKLKIIDRLTEVWDNGTDPVAVQLKKSIRKGKYFSDEFVEELVKASYTYSYHAFAEKYGIKPNRSFEDGKKVKIALSENDDEFDNYAENMAIRYLEYEECAFYELDFDGDGKNEIGIPLHSGAGGAFMMDGFGIFKENKDGLYEKYAGGPNCSMRDAMRLIKYDGRIYFVKNPFSDTMNEPHNITAHTIGKNGKGHGISITCNEYKPKEIMTKSYDNYNTDEFNSFIKEAMTQAYEAIAATKEHEMYNPNNFKHVKSIEELQNVSPGSLPMDVYFSADINNDGVKEFVRKCHLITQTKYYDDFNVFEIYDSESKLSKNPESMMEILPGGEYFGLHSGGNIYDLLPVRDKIVQFWTHEKDTKTYCLALTRNGLLYTLHVYTVQNKKTISVCHSLLFDEVQSIGITFSQE